METRSAETESGGQTTAQRGRKSPFLGMVVLAAVVSTLVSAAAVKVYHDQFATKILVVDMRQYVQDLGQKMMAGQLDQAGLEAALKEFDRKVQEDMPPGTVVLLHDVVVSDVKQIRP